jgi:NH3-dependent NAD+ synthetase
MKLGSSLTRHLYQGASEVQEQPRTLDPATTFNRVAQWFTDDVLGRNCPGILVGLSGTDSLVTFLAAYEGLKKAGKADRLLGVHFAPSEDFLYDHPEAEVHLWFSESIIPWVKQRAPEAQVIIDTSIDWRYDGLRWGAMADMSVVVNEHGRAMRPLDGQYWVSGTRNRSEDKLFSYSNASLMVSLQPLIHLWKSEVLQLSEHLGVPALAVAKSCETDCICGRERLPASHPHELDWLLMAAIGELDFKYAETHIPADLLQQLGAYMQAQMAKGSFKTNIPYLTPQSVVQTIVEGDELVQAFEDGSLNLRAFNHRKHLYVAWCYLKGLPFTESVERYMRCLRVLLEANGQTFRFSKEVTEAYFHKLDYAMALHRNKSFDQLMELVPSLLQHKK